MAVTRTGTASEVDGSGGNGSTSVTVPADATGAIVFFHHWMADSSEYDFLAATLSGRAFTFAQKRAKSGPTADANGVGVGWLFDLTATGSQTFAWTWLGPGAGTARDEGGGIYIVWVKGQHPVAPVRDFGFFSNDLTNAIAVELETETTDLLLGTCERYNDGGGGGGPAQFSGSPTTFINDDVVNNHAMDVAQLPPSAGSTTLEMTGENYSSMAAISLRDAADEPRSVASLRFAAETNDRRRYNPTSWAGTGAMSIAAIVKTPKAFAHNSNLYTYLFTVDDVAAGFGVRSTGTMFVYDGSNDRDGLTGLVEDEWYLIGISKATGTVTPRYHVYRYSTSTWSHGDFAGTIVNWPSPSSSIAWMNADGEGFGGSLLVGGLWDSELSDGTFETLELSLSAWVTAAPDELWKFNVSEPQTITGTAVQTVTSGGYLMIGSAPDDWADDEEIADTGLVVRYFLNEAASGTAPTQVDDSSSNSFHLDTIDYDSGDLVWTEDIAGNRGLDSSTVDSAQRVSKLVTNPSAVFSAIEGQQKITFELVLDIRLGSTNDARVFVINDPAGSDPNIGVSAPAGDQTLRFWWEQAGVADHNPGVIGRAVYHFVVDTTQSVAGNRIKIYVNGSQVTDTGTAMTQNDSFAGAEGQMIMFNRNSGGTYNRSPDAAIYYAAIYTGDFLALRASEHYVALAIDDDGPTVEPPAAALAFVRPTLVV